VSALRQELFRCGIVETSVFPDLDGLSRELKWQYTSPVGASAASTVSRRWQSRAGHEGPTAFRHL